MSGVSEERTLSAMWHDAAGPWLVEVGGAGEAHQRFLAPGSRLCIGSSRDSDLRVHDPRVSARHVELHADARSLGVLDLGSKNGTFLGPARVERALVGRAGATLVLGNTAVSVLPAVAAEVPLALEPLPGLIGRSRAMLAVAAQVRRLARLSRPVLVEGESGSGKDLVAKALHELGRAEGPFIPLNVGAIAESLADAELFGHQRGAFTGALEARPGAFEAAHRGTLFLDEIAELGASLQAKLLRVVEDGEVRPVGSARTTRVDVRLVSATWADLAERVADGQFRPDLYHRISTFVVRVPPLRRRRTDMPALCSGLLRRIEAEVGKRAVSSAALARLTAHGWPGNVRELSSVLFRAAVAAPGESIEPEHLMLDLPRKRVTVASRAPRPTERELRALLASHGGNKAAAARAAGVPRSTFRRLLQDDGGAPDG